MFSEAEAEAVLCLPGNEAGSRQLRHGERRGELPRAGRGSQAVYEGPGIQDLVTVSVNQTLSGTNCQ